MKELKKVSLTYKSYNSNIEVFFSDADEVQSWMSLDTTSDNIPQGMTTEELRKAFREEVTQFVSINLPNYTLIEDELVDLLDTLQFSFPD